MLIVWFKALIRGKESNETGQALSDSAGGILSAAIASDGRVVQDIGPWRCWVKSNLVIFGK